MMDIQHPMFELDAPVDNLEANGMIDLGNRHGAHIYIPLDVILVRGEGVWVFDTEGNRYLDCLSAYSALNQGHCHPRLISAMEEQLHKITLTSRAFRNEQLPYFAKELTELAGYDRVLPMNSGAEAVETALKLARKWAYDIKGVPRNQAEIIVADGNFHGRTISIISFSSEDKYRDKFGPHTPGFINIAYGSVEAVAEVITPNTAAVMIEPIQGEAGICIPPDGYLSDLYDLCQNNDILMIADEIQTGLGRTGKMFACEHENVHPDIMILGKALSGGMYPVSAVLADDEILGLFQPGDHGSTFGGNPLGAAVARAALKVIVEENLPQNAAELGQYFTDQLKKINSPHIKEIRGRGLLIGIELVPAADGARRFCEALKLEGILAKETHVNIIRLAPPLIIDRPTIDWALDRIEAVLQIT
jgi:ornithine--oxo-acid transaminase